jgi:RNA polymerase sigma factor (sigma-70 family)
MTSDPMGEVQWMSSREERFRRLHAEHFESIRRYAWRRDRSLADDVVSETFLVAWRRLDEVPEDAAPWLFGVARHVRLNLQRSARRQHALAERMQLTELGAESRDPVDEPVGVREALAALAERDREILLLHAWEGLDRRQIAAALDCSRANVSVRLHRARQRFAAALAADPRSQASAFVASISGGSCDVQ